MTIGVWPDATVCWFAWTGIQLPALFSLAKKSIPGPTLVSEPPLASAAANTPATAEPDVRGEPFNATWFLYSGFKRSWNVFGGFLTRFPL